MIEKIVIDYLLSKGITAYVEEPTEPTPDTFVIVQKTGSGLENLVYTATIAIQSYAPTIFEAAELNELVKTTMFGITELDQVTACGLNSDYVYMDLSKKRPRYQAVFDLVHY